MIFRSYVRIVLLVVTSLILCGCYSFFVPKKFAEIYVVSDPPGAEIFSGCDGQHLGITPQEIIFDSWNFPYEESVFAIVAEKDGYMPARDIIHVNRWYESEKEAKLNSNNIFFYLEKR